MPYQSVFRKRHYEEKKAIRNKKEHYGLKWALPTEYKDVSGGAFSFYEKRGFLRTWPWYPVI